MELNPFEAPDSPVDGMSEERGSDHLWFIYSLAIAALVEGVTGAFALGDSVLRSWVSRISLLCFFATPVVALLLSGAYAVRRHGRITLRSSTSQLVGVTFMTVIIAACGYVCFAMSCSFVNVATGGVKIGPNLLPQSPYSILGGIISAVTMVISCLLVAAIVSALQSPPPKSNKSSVKG